MARKRGPSELSTSKTRKKEVRKPNQIRRLRTKLKLSQRELAKKVGVSQQHIQRLETSDDINVGFVLAAKLCKVLGEPLDVVFPRTKRVMSTLPVAEDGRRRSVEPLFYDGRTREQMKKAGIDMDVTPWFIQMKLRGRAETVDVLLGDGEYSRLWRVLQSESPDEAFVIFEGADGYVYAVHPKHLLSWQFKFDPVDVPRTRDLDSDGNHDKPDGPDDTIRVWFSDGTPVIELDGEMDEPTEFHDIGPLNYILFMLEHSDEGCYSLVDSAGEPFWFRASDVALLAAPHHLIGEEDDEEENTETDDGVMETNPLDPQP